MSDTEYLKIPMSDIKTFISNPDNLKGKRKVSGWTKGNSDVQNVLLPYKLFTNKILEVNKVATKKPESVSDAIAELKEELFVMHNTLNAMNSFYTKAITTQNDYMQTLKKMNDIIVEIHKKMFPKTKAIELTKKAVKKKK